MPEPGADPFELKYHHYSVVHEHDPAGWPSSRPLTSTAASAAADPCEEQDKWFFDPRIDRAEQVGDELYASNPFDRGHLVRRLDPAWGRTLRVAKVANDDTFHFTNCTPQHAQVQRGEEPLGRPGGLPARTGPPATASG